MESIEKIQELSITPNILISAHDLGGANQILHSTKNLNNVDYVLTGPALQVAHEINIKNLIDPGNLDLQLYSELIIGSNSSLQFSDYLLESAQSIDNLKVTGYLDHWVNYKTRWKFIPDKIVTTDLVAFVSALRFFGPRVRLQQNAYLKSIRHKLYEQERNDEKISSPTALFILQPIENAYKHGADFATCFCGHVLKVLESKNFSSVILRSHVDASPEDCKKYLNVEISNIRIIQSSWKESIESDLIQADWVLGMDSYALYVAKKLGKRTYSLGGRRAILSPKFRPFYR